MKKLYRSNFLCRSAVIVAGLFLGACANLYPELENYQAKPKTLTVQEYTYGTDALFAGNDEMLLPKEAKRLASYVQRMAIGKYDRVKLVVFENDPTSYLAGRRIDVIRSILGKQDIRVDDITWSAESGEDEGGRIRLLVDRYLVTLPGCPDWTKSSVGSFDNQVHSNWGCATSTNLGAMIAEPRDLIIGRSDNYTDGNYAIKSIQRYQMDSTKEIVTQATSESL